MTNTHKIIKNWIKNNYGKSEADEPSYDLKTMASGIDSRYKLDKIKERLQTLLQYHFEQNQEKYFVRRTTGGFGDEGAAANEDIYDEVKSAEDFLDNYKWVEDSELVDLITQMLWEL